VDEHCGNLPDRHDVWSVIQDHVNGNLLFAGTEFGLFTSVDGGRQAGFSSRAECRRFRFVTWRCRGVRTIWSSNVRPRFYVLDDFSPLREITPQTLTEDARSFRCATHISSIRPPCTGWHRGIGAMAGNWTSPNPPYGAVLTYNVKNTLVDDAKLVITIADDTGRQVAPARGRQTTGVAPDRLESPRVIRPQVDRIRVKDAVSVAGAVVHRRAPS
jgi:hypothetical protein